MRHEDVWGDLRVVSLTDRFTADADGSGRRDLVLSELESQAARMAGCRRARRLARVLLNQLGLYPDSMELVSWVDGVADSRNLALLTDWVQSQLLDADFEFACGAGLEVTELTRRLEHHFAMRDAANDSIWDGA